MDEFGLYWWRPRDGWINIGDEISPIVLGHVTGRRIVFRNVDDCDGVAVGSVFYPLKAKRRRRKAPLFVWGTGTLKPKHDDYRNLWLNLAALRGPKTWAEIENCPDVPFGDPGLFVREIWPQPGSLRQPGRVGIIAHHSMQHGQPTRRLLDGIDGASLVSITQPDIAKMMRQVAKCSLVISSSLHGMVFADAFGVPSLFWNEAGEENEWKFRDYFAGAGRPDFAALTMAEILAVSAGGRVADLPFSVLSEAALTDTLSRLRAAARAIPGGFA